MPLSRKSPDASANALIELIGQSFRLNSRLQTTADRMARDAGLTGTRWQVLSAISQATRPATISDIARWMGLARQSVQQVADALAKEGFISYEPNPKHKRAALVAVTKKATKLLEQLDKQRFEWACTTATALSAADIEAANKVLSVIRQQLSD